MKAIIVIPIYKEVLSEEETRSLRRCLRVLGSHPICLVCPKGLRRTAYDRLFREAGTAYTVQYFAPEYFESQRGYNRLMLNIDFYRRFADSDYMLICQLDAYVFSDRLHEWCAKGYDYVGAPFLKLNGKIDWRNCGNGGFSLRRISSFIEALSYRGRLYTLRGLWRFYRYRGPLHRLPLTLSGYFGRGNRLPALTADNRLNEDLIYAMLDDSRLKWRIPDSRQAARFSFEGGPGELYAYTGQLPFGCHAYRKCDYETFYKPIFKQIAEEEEA